MKNFLKEIAGERRIWISAAVWAAAGIVNGIRVSPFYLHFLNGLTIAGFALLIVGLCKWFWKEGDFAFFSWKPKSGSYTRYRSTIIEERRSEKNPWLTAGLMVTAIALVLSLLY